MVCAGSPTSTKSLSPRRLQKMRRVRHTHTHTDATPCILTDHTRAQFSLDRHGCSLPLLCSFRPLFALVSLFLLSPSPLSLSFFYLHPSLSLSPPYVLSLATALGRSTVVCQAAKCNDKHFFSYNALVLYIQYFSLNNTDSRSSSSAGQHFL